MEELKKEQIGQEQIHNILFNREVDWQELIYDLINTEQLDPWNINITVLTDKYLEKIQQMEEADFFVSSKVLLAAALLLRIKSEILLNKYIKSIDEILFGKKEQKISKFERIELDEEIPPLIPRSPIPRFKKVTLKELIESLNKAITTENRRIKKEIINKNALREAEVSLSKRKKSIKDKIREIYIRLFGHFEQNKGSKKITFTDFIGEDKEDKIMSFYPLLQLEHQNKVWLEQEKHFEEINIWMKKTYIEHKGDPFADLRQELEINTENLDKDQKSRLKKIEKDFQNPLGDIVE